MITKEEFNQLKGGDIIIWKGIYMRTILCGPLDKPDQGKAVEFSIRRRSWTNRAKTVYFWNDIKHWITIPHKKAKGLIMKSEVEVLKSIGFDPRKELASEIKREEAYAKRRGLPLCGAFSRIKKLTL